MAALTCRCVLAMLGTDVHTKGLRVLSRLLRDAGAEVIYLGEHNSAMQVASVAVDEDVDVVGISFSVSSYLAHTAALRDALQAVGASQIALIVGGLIHADDEEELREMGVSAIFGPGTSFDDVVAFLSGLGGGEPASENGV